MTRWASALWSRPWTFDSMFFASSYFNRDSWAWQIIIIIKKDVLSCKFSVFSILSSALIQKLVPSQQCNNNKKNQQQKIRPLLSYWPQRTHKTVTSPPKRKHRLVAGDDPQSFLWAAPSRSQSFFSPPSHIPPHRGKPASTHEKEKKWSPPPVGLTDTVAQWAFLSLVSEKKPACFFAQRWRINSATVESDKRTIRPLRSNEDEREGSGRLADAQVCVAQSHSGTTISELLLWRPPFYDAARRHTTQWPDGSDVN